MKIKQVFEKESVNNDNVYVSINSKEFNGLLKANSPASFIIDSLKDDLTEEELIEKMLAKYKADRHMVELSVHRVLQQLKELDLLDK